MRTGIVRIAVCVLAGLVVTNAANASGSYGGANGFTPPKIKKESKPAEASEPKKDSEPKKEKKKKSSGLSAPGDYSRNS